MTRKQFLSFKNGSAKLVDEQTFINQQVQQQQQQYVNQQIPIINDVSSMDLRVNIPENGPAEGY